MFDRPPPPFIVRTLRDGTPQVQMRSWSAEDPIFSDGSSLHDVTIGMRLAVNAPGAIGPILS